MQTQKSVLELQIQSIKTFNNPTYFQITSITTYRCLLQDYQQFQRCRLNVFLENYLKLTTIKVEHITVKLFSLESNICIRKIIYHQIVLTAKGPVVVLVRYWMKVPHEMEILEEQMLDLMSLWNESQAEVRMDVMIQEEKKNVVQTPSYFLFLDCYIVALHAVPYYV